MLPLRVLTVLLEPVESKDRFEGEKIVAGTRHDFFWLNKACQENLPRLTEIDPLGVVDVAERQLIKAVDLEHDPKIDDKDKKLNSYWRLNINPDAGLYLRSDFRISCEYDYHCFTQRM